MHEDINARVFVSERGFVSCYNKDLSRRGLNPKMLSHFPTGSLIETIFCTLVNKNTFLGFIWKLMILSTNLSNTYNGGKNEENIGK